MFQDIYASELVQMSFDVSAETAIKRLNAKVRRFGFSRSNVMVGAVTIDSVKIQRSANYVTNSFRPIFVGHFETENGKTILSGNFRINRFVQISFTFWRSAILLFTMAVAINSIVQAKVIASLPIVFAGFLLIVLSAGIVKFSKWISCGDKAWLIKEIGKTINKIA